MSIRQHEQQGCRAEPMTTATGRTTNESRAPFLPRLLADRKKSQRLWMPPEPESLLSPRRSPLDISPSHAHIRPPSRRCQPASLSLVSSGWLVYKNPVGRWTQSNSCFPLHLDRCWTCAIATLPPISTTSLLYQTRLISTCHRQFIYSPPPIVG